MRFVNLCVRKKKINNTYFLCIDCFSWHSSAYMKEERENALTKKWGLPLKKEGNFS